METPNKSDTLLDDNDNRCRVCLSANDDNKCIFTTLMIFDFENDNETKLWEKLQLYGGIEVGHNDGLPKKICNDCISRLLVAHDFRIQCQVTDKKLRVMQKKITNDEGLKEKEEINKLEEPQKSFTKTPLSLPRRISTNSDHPNCSENTKSIKRKIVRENKQVRKKEIRSRRLMIIKRSSFEKLCSPYKISTQKSISPTANESSKSTLRNPENAKSKVSRFTSENSSSKSESLRSRRFVIFKRVTSMESLKNRKLRQRQYMKKTNFSKRESEEREVSQKTDKKRHAPAQKVPRNITILPYKCPKCCRSYSTEKSLREHQKSHEYKKFSCDQCDERFVKLAEFLHHAKSHELNEKLQPANCKICNKHFRKFLTMIRHLHVHKRENPRAVYAILRDIRYKRESRNSKISIENIANFDDSRRIISDHREENLAAQEKSTESVQIYSSNRDKKNYDDKSEIPSDDRSAIKLINIWIREELDYDIEGKGFPCANCSKSYVTKKSLIKHISKMHENCDFCSGNCICPDSIHKNNKEREKSKLYSCSECEKSFEAAAKLEKHLRIHARERENCDKNFKRFLCHICSKTFRQNTGLMFHMRTHTGYKPHICKYCGRGFTSNSNRTNHERTHTGDKPFICHFCSAAFAKSCTLKAHITTHTGEANYHCKTCGKSFRRLKYLKEHRFTHTGEKPYACKICGTAYSHSGSLFVHEKKCKVQPGNFRDIGENYSAEMKIGASNSMMHLAINEHKNYIDSQRINGQNIIDNVHINNSHSSNLTDLTSSRQTFTIIEETFRT